MEGTTYIRKYYLGDRENRLAKQRAYYEAHAEKRREYQRAYRAAKRKTKAEESVG